MALPVLRLSFDADCAACRWGHFWMVPRLPVKNARVLEAETAPASRPARVYCPVKAET